jgi:hypothetical protein
MSSAWMKIIDLHNKETYGDHLWIPFRWTGDQTFIHDRYTYVHFAIFFYIVKSIIHIWLGLCEALCLASFASCSRRGRTGERCTISRAGTAKSLSTTIWLSLPPQNEQQGGRPSVNTVGTIRCWKWMFNHIKDIYRELAFASCGHRCLEWILWVLHRHCDQDRLCGCNMSLIWFLQMDIYGCADFRQGFWE